MLSNKCLSEAIQKYNISIFTYFKYCLINSHDCQAFRQSKALADSLSSMLRCFRIIKPAFEKSRSAGTLVAGIAKKSLAILARFGYKTW